MNPRVPAPARSRSSAPVCPDCGGESGLTLRTADYNRRLSPQTFTYYLCRRCALIFLDPLPQNLSDFYPPDYYPVPASLAQLAVQAEAERFKLDLIRPMAPGGRLLEIGPAYGAFAYLARQAGYEVAAVEMDADCCRYLAEVVGVRVVQSRDPAEAVAALGRFDVIALWHVIEHLPDPHRVLAALAAHLQDGGHLVVAAPNPQAFQYRVFGARWAHVDAPRHLRLIPLPLLARWLQACALQPVLMTTSDVGGRSWNRFGWQVSLANLSTRPGLNRLLRFVGRVAGWLLRPVEQAGLRGSTYTAIFRKVRE